MKKARKGLLLLVASLVLSLGLVGSVWGQPVKAGRGGAILTPEQTGKIFDLREKFQADTVDLRRQLAVKMAELNALEKVEKPDEKAVQAKKKELEPMREKLREKMTALQEEVKKIAPESRMGMGMGMGPGPGMGPRPGRGPGPHGMGAGPGAPPAPAKQPGETPPPPAAPPAK